MKYYILDCKYFSIVKSTYILYVRVYSYFYVTKISIKKKT